MIYTPYTYLVGWTEHNKWYYGSETSNKRPANPNNLWKIYFTSSKYVKEFREQYGDPDVIEIRKIFKTKDQARNWEYKVLQRMKVVFADKWLNKTDNRAYDRTGTLSTEETKIKLRGRVPWNKGKKMPEDVVTKMKISKTGKNTGKDNSNFGNVWSKEQRNKMSERQRKEKNNMYKKTHTPEALAKMAAARKKYWETHKCIPWNKGLKQNSGLIIEQ